MEFLDVKKVFMEKGGLERVTYMTPELNWVSDWVVKTLDLIEKAITGETIPEISSEEISDVNSLINLISRKILTSKVAPPETEVLISIGELFLNWEKLFDLGDQHIRDSISLYFSVVRIEKTLSDQVTILGILGGQIREIMAAEPVESRISKMYSDKLESYFKTTRKGEYKVD